MCFPGSSGRATSSSVQRASASTSAGATKPRAISQPCSREVAPWSAVTTGYGELDACAAPCWRGVMSSVSDLLAPRQDLLSRARDIGGEIYLSPRQVGDVLIAETVGMREHQIADGGLVL